MRKVDIHLYGTGNDPGYSGCTEKEESILFLEMRKKNIEGRQIRFVPAGL